MRQDSLPRAFELPARSGPCRERAAPRMQSGALAKDVSAKLRVSPQHGETTPRLQCYPDERHLCDSSPFSCGPFFSAVRHSAFLAGRHRRGDVFRPCSLAHYVQNVKKQNVFRPVLQLSSIQTFSIVPAPSPSPSPLNPVSILLFVATTCLETK